MAKAKKLPSGNWRVQVFIGKDANGKNIMKSFCAPTRKEAEKLGAEFELTGKKNLKRFTVGQALDGYMDLKRNVLSPSTIHGYGIIRRNRLQSLMTMDIHEVDSFAMQKAINEDAATKGQKSIREAKNLIVTAVRMYGVNIDLKVTLPPKKPVIKNLPTAEQVICMIRGTDIELPCMLSMWLSLRISEVRGLQFGDIKDGVMTDPEGVKRTLSPKSPTEFFMEGLPEILCFEEDGSVKLCGQQIIPQWSETGTVYARQTKQSGECT